MIDLDKLHEEREECRADMRRLLAYSDSLDRLLARRQAALPVPDPERETLNEALERLLRETWAIVEEVRLMQENQNRITEKFKRQRQRISK